jgi:hypothetical protein
MSASTTTTQHVARGSGQARRRDWLTILFWFVVIALIAIAVWMRLYGLGLPFDRDGYDEGVYWQSLRSMNVGYSLYSNIFYSQPPFFLLSTFPTFALLGGSLWSARLGIALVSLLGLLGAVLLGKALSGRTGALAALLLVVANSLYLAQSQTIQAEASSTAFELLAMGLAFYWWKYPLGKRGIALAILTGTTVALSILCKLLSVASLVPIAMLMAARLWLIASSSGQSGDGEKVSTGDEDSERNREDTRKGRPYASIIAGIIAFIITGVAFLLPFAGAYQAFISGVITFHTSAAQQFSQSGNLPLITTSLVSLLALAALYGSLTALLRQDWRVLPLLAWFLVSAYLLLRQVPLFPHHLVSLVPPLVALAIMGIAPLSPASKTISDRAGLRAARFVMTGLAIVLVLLTTAVDLQQDAAYYHTAQARSVDGLAQLEARAATDLRNAISPDQQVITDAQFVAALADRNTPPPLVDTSMVRINTGYLTLAQLESIASQPQVHAILFFSGRFHLPPVAAFHAWVTQHYHLLHDYDAGRELWVR